jgi:hypothetical protein
MPKSLPNGSYPQISSVYSILHNFFTEWKKKGHTIKEIGLAEITIKSEGKSVKNCSLRPEVSGLKVKSCGAYRQSNQIKWRPDTYYVTSSRSMNAIREDVQQCLMNLGWDKKKAAEHDIRIRYIISECDGHLCRWELAGKDGEGEVPIMVSVDRVAVPRLVNVALAFGLGEKLQVSVCDIVTTKGTQSKCAYSGKSVVIRR